MKKEKLKLIRSGEVCPYCFDKPDRVDSSIIYGKSFGDIMICSPCRAYVGVHKDTGEPLGRLANHSLREKKKAAHMAFDHLWKSGKINKIYRKWIPNTTNRAKAYEWLSLQMKMPKKYCHIGMMDESECERVIEICKPYHNA